jgi:hypothetical protein
VGDLLLIIQQKTQVLVEKAVLLETHKYLTLFQGVFKTQRLFAVELLAEEVPHPVLETVRQEARLHAPVTVRPKQLVGENALETIFKVLVLLRLITITATLLLHLLQQHTPVRLLWVLAAVQGLPLAQGLTAIPAVRVAA